MKHQQVVVDYTVMIKSCLTCLMLAFSGYILIRLVCTIFVLPKWIEKQREIEELKLQNEAMALKTKKFVQFLSAEKVDEGDVEETDLKESDDVINEDVVEDDNSTDDDDKETVDLEKKKDK